MSLDYVLTSQTLVYPVVGKRIPASWLRVAKISVKPPLLFQQFGLTKHREREGDSLIVHTFSGYCTYYSKDSSSILAKQSYTN